LTADNILSVFDENGMLRDAVRRNELEQMATDDGEPRKHWKTLRMNAMDARKRGRGLYVNPLISNWPIEPRYYGKESVEYEKKIKRIKKQFIANPSYEIIGDLLGNSKLITTHPMTIKHGRKGKEKGKSALYKENRQIIYKQIGLLMAKKLNRTENEVRYKKIRDAIFGIIWKSFENDKSIETAKKLEMQGAADYVGKTFEGMFMVFSMQISN